MSLLSPDRVVLPNGLVLLTVTRTDVPLVAVLLVYRAGSLYEPAGKTGLAHLTEHMMFRGTPCYPQGRIDLLTGRLGGTNNAMTTSDHALYYFVLPSEHWRTPLEIEADRMLNCGIETEAFETEKQVAVEERRMLDDDPYARLFEAVDAIAIESHPYRYPVVGMMPDLERLAAPDVRAFYRERYTPDNAVLCVVGDVDRVAVAEAVGELFGGAGRGSAPSEDRAGAGARPRRTEPVQARVSHGSGASKVVLAFDTPEATHPDTPALELLATLLAAGRSSLLYRRMVSGLGVATEVSASKLLQVAPGLFYISASLHPGASHDVCENEVLGVLEELRSEEISDDELVRARRLTEVDLVLGREASLGLAGALGFWESLGDWRLGNEYERRLAGVRPSDVRRVCEKYLSPESRSTAWLTP